MPFKHLKCLYTFCAIWLCLSPMRLWMYSIVKLSPGLLNEPCPLTTPLCSSSLSCKCLNIAPVFIFLPLLFPSALIFSSPQWSSCAPLSERSRRNALAQGLETSWIPECALCRKALRSEMESLQVSMAERTNRRKHWGNPVILQHWPIIYTQSWGRKPLLILKSILRAGKGVHTTQSSHHSFFALITEYLLFHSQLSPSRFFFLLWTVQKGYFWTVEFIFYFLYIFQMFRESWRLMHFHSMRSMDQGMDGACWSVVNYW